MFFFYWCLFKGEMLIVDEVNLLKDINWFFWVGNGQFMIFCNVFCNYFEFDVMKLEQQVVNNKVVLVSNVLLLKLDLKVFVVRDIGFGLLNLDGIEIKVGLLFFYFLGNRKVKVE